MSFGMLSTMPLLVMNMGGEMIYILQQRLEAQKIPEDKSKKVLGDVGRTMFNKKFLSELFKPQEMYSNHATRHIFDRLAHSSIMRLNESSMDKLYDLMTMGFKYQVLSCSSPDQLLSVTLNHLESVKVAVDTLSFNEIIDDAILRTIQMFEDLSNGERLLLKHQLCRFFQDRKVKVSLFLQEGIQNFEGKIILNSSVLTKGADVPGRIKFYDTNEVEINKRQFVIPGMQHYVNYDDEENKSFLGLNLYSSKKSVIPKTSEQLLATSKSSLPLKQEHLKKKESTATEELNLLADILGSAIVESAHDSKPFKLNLFPDESFQQFKDENSNVPTIYINASSDRKSVCSLMDDFHFDEKPEGKGNVALGEDDDDLLELMDSTTTT